MTTKIKKYQNALQLLDPILCECCKDRILAACPLQSPSKKWEGSLENVTSLYRSGKTLREIGDIYGVTREWIRQLLKHEGVTGRDGGAAVSARKLAQKKEEQKNRRSLEKHGCLYAEYRYLVKKGVTRAWKQQRGNAAARGIAWNLKLFPWWLIWRDSGKWEERGIHAEQYCMSRFGDSGAYEEGNVEIIRSSENSSDGVAIAHQNLKEPSNFLEIIRVAGGRSLVANALGIKPGTLAGMANSNYIPRSWDANGRVEKLSELTGGIYEAEEIRELVGYRQF